MKLDLKQISMKKKKDEDKTHKEKTECGEEIMKDQRAEDKGPSDKGQRTLGFCCCCESLVTVWKSSLSRQGVGSGNETPLHVCSNTSGY